MGKLRVYLDNCCYNRPYDDQRQMRIHLEAEAKLYIQQMIVEGRVELATSFALDYERDMQQSIARKESIERFMRENERVYVGNARYDDAARLAEKAMATGIKRIDATHIACAILARCDCFLTTDDRLLKYHSDEIDVMSVCEFVIKWSGSLPPREEGERV